MADPFPPPPTPFAALSITLLPVTMSHGGGNFRAFPAGSSAASAASAQPACHSDWSLDAGGVHSDGKGSGATGSAVSMAGKGVHGDNRGGGVRAGAPLAVTLEQILMYNFYDNRVEGLRRTVSGEKESKVNIICGGLILL